VRVRSPQTIRRAGSRPSRRLWLVGVTVVVTGGLVFAVNAALARRQSAPPSRGPLAVLMRAHAADEPVLREALSGAATVTFAREGPPGDEVFVATMDSGAICLVDQAPLGPAGAPPTDAAGLIAVACGTGSQAETVGLGLASPTAGQVPAKITLLLPNDVQSVDFQTTGGAVTAEPTAGNVVQYAASDLTSATYATGGRTVVVQVPAPPA